ncbi:JHBP domain containing protein [Asbolus verrucosus]|uniref:JHBP domain containing protein n=1 Tax=Asbolus verrucosus TaxID=1661398 RepID=A0A482W9W9_ASBVE|nr:JHBP domain containing protein [Asbolus verrucosus]
MFGDRGSRRYFPIKKTIPRGWVTKYRTFNIPNIRQGPGTIIATSSFKKCNRKQANFNQCLTVALEKKPFSEIELPNIEPLVFSSLSVPSGNEVLRFTQNYKNFTVSKSTTGNVIKFE